MLKRQLFKITLIAMSLSFSTVACSKNNQSGNTMPPHATISVEESPETFKKNNEKIKQYWKFNDNPLNISDLGVTFYDLKFPADNYGTATFIYPDIPPLTIDNVSGTSSYYSHDRSERGIQSATIRSFIPNAEGSYGVTQEDAFITMQKLFKQLEEQGWVYNNFIGSPRLSIKDSYAFANDDSGSTIYLDFHYPLSLQEFKNLERLQSWHLRHGTDVLLNINTQYHFEEEVNQYFYLISLDFKSESQYSNSLTNFSDPNDPFEVAFEKYYAEMPASRLLDETRAIKMGLKIQQDQPDYTLPLILEKTGIDTSKFISIDPYKITYEEFIKRQEAGEDMTPYYENQTKPNQPDITSQARGRCLAGQPCPKSGYWHTFANADSRAYFKQGDIMPDYPNNSWGEVIWQFEGEQG